MQFTEEIIFELWPFTIKFLDHPETQVEPYFMLYSNNVFVAKIPTKTFLNTYGENCFDMYISAMHILEEKLIAESLVNEKEKVTDKCFNLIADGKFDLAKIYLEILIYLA